MEGSAVGDAANAGGSIPTGEGCGLGSPSVPNAGGFGSATPCPPSMSSCRGLLGSRPKTRSPSPSPSLLAEGRANAVPLATGLGAGSAGFCARATCTGGAATGATAEGSDSGTQEGPDDKGGAPARLGRAFETLDETVGDGCGYETRRGRSEEHTGENTSPL